MFAGTIKVRAIAPTIAILILVLTTLTAAILLYTWTSGYVSSANVETESFKLMKVEAYEKTGKTLTLYVRNLGKVNIIVDSIYLIAPNGTIYKLQPAVVNSSTEIWGGDIWKVNLDYLKVSLAASGKIVYDNFETYRAEIWNKDYVNYNNTWEAVDFNPDGLKLLSKSSDGWAVRGLISRNKIVNLNNLPIVIEVDLQKTDYNLAPHNNDAAGSPFAACLYLSSVKKRNPYFATPWFAAKLYFRDRYQPRTEAQLVTRSSILNITTLYTWYSAPNTEPRGIFLIVFNETNKVYYYFWANDRTTLYTQGSWAPRALQDIFQSKTLYIYLTIDNKVHASPRKVHVRYIQIYRGTKLVITGVRRGWTVELTDSSWNVLYRKIATGSKVEFNILNYILENGMPLEGHIRVKTFNESEIERYGGLVIKPKELKEIIVALPNIESGTYTLKIVGKSGIEYYVKIRV